MPSAGPEICAKLDSLRALPEPAAVCRDRPLAICCGNRQQRAHTVTGANQPAATRNSRGLKMAPAFWDRQRVSCCLWSRAPWPDASCSDASHPELAVQTEPLHPDITSLVCYGTYSISPTLSRPQAYQGLKGNPPLQGGEVVSLWKHCICASA
ncbi:uncharacterized protein [Anas acuta]|uniref:uncharacterized protein isoform X3 n=1 Tax=Anas acuta TaxID=28680 RepID=UPI0035C8F2DC